MYTFSSKLRIFSIILLVLGLVLFGIGYTTNHSIDTGKIEQIMADAPKKGDNVPMHSHEKTIDTNAKKDGHDAHAEHLEHAEHQVHNRPLAALHTMAVFLFGLSACALFFYSVQIAAHAGWPIIILRVMEAVASFLPYGGALLLIIVILNVTHQSHLFHWMDTELINPKSKHFDPILFEKKLFLNIPFYVVRTLIYVVGATFFLFKLKSLSKKLDLTKDKKDFSKMYAWNIGYIAFFGFATASWAWDWLMSIDPHWYSTMYIWYALVSGLTSAVAVIVIISVYLKRAGFLPQFNDNHLHDLGKFLFATAMLWTYTWFCQFMLYWYANIPEEANYFFGRFEHYSATYLPMLIFNFLIPLAVMVSSSIKRNYNVVLSMAVLIIIGHYMDFFNMVMPGTVGIFWGFGFLEIGAILFVGGLFVLTVMSALSKLKLIPEGNPYLHESEIFEYPF